MAFCADFAEMQIKTTLKVHLIDIRAFAIWMCVIRRAHWAGDGILPLLRVVLATLQCTQGVPQARSWCGFEISDNVERLAHPFCWVCSPEVVALCEEMISTENKRLIYLFIHCQIRIARGLVYCCDSGHRNTFGQLCFWFFHLFLSGNCSNFNYSHFHFWWHTLV